MRLQLASTSHLEGHILGDVLEEGVVYDLIRSAEVVARIGARMKTYKKLQTPKMHRYMGEGRAET